MTDSDGGSWVFIDGLPPDATEVMHDEADRETSTQFQERAMHTEIATEGADDSITWPCDRPEQLPDDKFGIQSLKGQNEWPARIVMTTITITSEEAAWSKIGCLSIANMSLDEQLGHALQFQLGDRQSIVRMTPSIISWPPSADATAHIRAYDQTIVPQCPEYIAVVPLLADGGDIDWNRIRGVTEHSKTENVPDWLPELCLKIARFQRLEQMGRLWSPVGPLPNPLRMEAVLCCGCGSGKQAFQVLSLQGVKTIFMIFAIAFYVKQPFDDACQLERRVQEELSCKRLAATCAKSGLLAELTGSTGSVDMNTDANVVRAVIGAFVGEKAGDFYSVVQVWQWLTQSSLCQTTLRFLDHAPTKFKGRTPTYKTFKQVKVDGALELHVDFEDHQVVRFCRPAMDGNQSAHLLGSFLLQEDVTEVKHAWRSVQYDGSNVTYACNFGHDGNNIHQALPNKIQRWLRGVHAAALISTYNKNAHRDTLAPHKLCAMLSGSLRVLYESKGSYVYRRCSQGGLGYELKTHSDEEHPVLYSERPEHKTLLSPSENVPLPKIISEWLLSDKSLYQLHRIDRPRDPTGGVHVLENKWDYIIWQSRDGVRWKCCRKCCDRDEVASSLAVVFTAGHDDENQVEVEYVGHTCVAADGSPIPEVVLQWMMKAPERNHEEKICRAYIETQQKSNITTCRAPPQEKRFEHMAKLDQAEEVLQHKFSNRMLLAEALSQITGIGTGNPINKTSKNNTQDAAKHAQSGASDTTRGERRVARDGKAYTKNEFQQYYLGFWEDKWNTAKPVADMGMEATSLTSTTDDGEARRMNADVKECIHKRDLQRLAFVGNAVAEQVTARILVANAPFSTAATLSQHDQTPNEPTFAVGAPLLYHTGSCMQLPRMPPEYQWPADREGLSEGARWEIIPILGLDIRDPESLKQRLDACCNNVAYARTCVDLGLHKAMLECSPELEDRVSCFVKVYSKANKKDENPWHRLLRHGAPRALGNTFTACLGAIIMDGAHGGESSAYLDIKRLLVDHVQNCLSLPVNHNDTTITRGPDDTCTESDQGHKATDLTDVHGQEWSPRSALLRAPYACSDVDSDYTDDDEEEEQPDEPEEGQQDNNNGQAIYCELCEMWTNGRTQWEDHIIGKKHKKNRKKKWASFTVRYCSSLLHSYLKHSTNVNPSELSVQL